MPTSRHFNKKAALKAANHMANQGYYKVHIDFCSSTKDKRIKYQVGTQGVKRKYLIGSKKGRPKVGEIIDHTK